MTQETTELHLDEELTRFLLGFFTTSMHVFMEKWTEGLPNKPLSKELQALVAVIPFVAYYQYRIDRLAGLHSDGASPADGLESISSLASTVKVFKETFEEYGRNHAELGVHTCEEK